jgi:hypothetical protein
VTDNFLYAQSADIIRSKDLVKYFYDSISTNSGIAMMLARPSIDTDTFFDELVVSKWIYRQSPITTELDALTKESNVWRDKFFF